MTRACLVLVTATDYIHPGSVLKPEAEFLEVTGTKVLRVFLLAIHPLLTIFTPSPLEQKWFETGL
jgi:hypothetical protein